MDPLIANDCNPDSLFKPMKHFFFTLLAMLALAAPMQARTINWGGAAFDNLYTSYGSALDDSFTFELGTFGAFVPTELNQDQWLANWRVFDRATAANSGWTSSTGFFESSANLNDNGTSSSPEANPLSTFALGEQAYIWAFNTQQMTFGYTEWALITNNSSDGNSADNWTFPAPTDHSLTPLEWRVSLATNVPYGGLNSVEGPGGYTVNPVTFDLQTHSVVPEPGSALLLTALGLIGLRRRRR